MKDKIQFIDEKPKKENDSEKERHKNVMKELEAMKELILLNTINISTERRKTQNNDKEEIKEPKKEAEKEPEKEPEKEKVIEKKKPKKKFKVNFNILLYSSPLLILIMSFFAFYIILNSFFDIQTTYEKYLYPAIISFVAFILDVILVIIIKMRTNKADITDIDNRRIKVVDDNLEDVKICPICNSKVEKSKIIIDGNQNKQIIRCKNPACEFRKEIKFNL